ncbi:hypothetical protein Hdeb2414_s0018g00535381 [Helianthus debilis subsp. tardiflorus]
MMTALQLYCVTVWLSVCVMSLCLQATVGLWFCLQLDDWHSIPRQVIFLFRF